MSNTLVTIERGETGSGSKAKEGISREEQRTALEGIQKQHIYREQLPRLAAKLEISDGQYPSPGGIFTMSQMSAFCIGSWRVGGIRVNCKAQRDPCVRSPGQRGCFPS